MNKKVFKYSSAILGILAGVTISATAVHADANNATVSSTQTQVVTSAAPSTAPATSSSAASASASSTVATTSMALNNSAAPATSTAPVNDAKAEATSTTPANNVKAETTATAVSSNNQVTANAATSQTSQVTATTQVKTAGWYGNYWQQNGSDWSYIKGDGTKAEDEWLLINGSWYYFNGYTMVANGWHNASWNGEWNDYYFDANGHYETNCWHAYRANSRVDTPVEWSYSKSDGTRADSEWLWINGAWYYFDGNTMVANGWHEAEWNGEFHEYYFDANGHCC